MDHLLCPTCGMHCFNDEDLETHECFIYCYQGLTSTSFRIMCPGLCYIGDLLPSWGKSALFNINLHYTNIEVLDFAYKY